MTESVTTALDAWWREPRMARLSMEVALHPGISTCARGFGVLAGDTMRSAADLELARVPMGTRIPSVGQTPSLTRAGNAHPRRRASRGGSGDALPGADGIPGGRLAWMVPVRRAPHRAGATGGRTAAPPGAGATP